ncbi:MAG: 30S ribosomal protein S3 [Bacteroidales bacterium]|jgi:small subunit ribosomal protein S3|nr:30S ribosomal protein S3 [Bacteroidales bacterium]
MGHKTSPIGNRLGIIRGWESQWYGGKKFEERLVEDAQIRKYLGARLEKASVSKILIERSFKKVTITVVTARPGLIIGKGGEEVDKLKEELKKLTQKDDIQINIQEEKRPEQNALLVAQQIARQLEGRIAYRKAIKNAIGSTMRLVAGEGGIKVQISGRLGGAEMARTEQYKDGRIPLHTLRSNIDYALAEAHTTYGRIGIKVWICKGVIYGKPEIVTSFAAGADDKRSFAGSGNDRGFGGERRGSNNRGGRSGDRRGGNGGRGGDRGGRSGERRPKNN